jgi:8-oxo-dGTP pyrophosphatase MutT (NUDIX family)
MTELWDILNDNGSFTGRVAERDAMLRGEETGYHLVVHVYIVNTRGEWLIQKRSATKAFLPGKWDITGGAVLAGEDSLTAALRETREEIGITLDPELMYIEKRLKWPGCFADIRVARAEFDTTDCTLDPAEVDAVRWVDSDDFLSIVFGETEDPAYRSLAEGFVRQIRLY